MERPAPRQWVVLWVGAIWVLLTLAVAEEYVLRGVFAALVVTGLLYWQLAPRQSKPGPVERPEPDAPLAPASRSIPEPVLATGPTRLEPTGVGGWLALLIFGIGIATPISAVVEIARTASTAEGAWAFGGSLLVLVAFAAGGVYTGWALWRRWPDAPKTALWFILGVAGLSAVGFVMLIIEGADPAQTAGQIVGLSVWVLVWTSYLRKSRRVRNTYVPNADLGAASRTSVKISVAALAAVLMWLGSALYSNGQSRIEQQYAEINPYQWVKATRQMDPTFTKSFADGVLQRLRPTLPRSTLTLAGPASFEDLGSALRAVVRYTAEIDTDAGGTATLEGEMRSYFHAHGVAVVESGCVTELLECSGMQQMIAAVEEALLPKLNSSQLAGILPDGKCATESVTLPGSQRSATVMSCSYTDSEAASLSLTRSTLDEARVDMRARINATSEFKRALVKQVSALQ